MSERQEFRVGGPVIDHSGQGGDRSYTAQDGYTGPMKVIGGTGSNWFYGDYRPDWYQGGADRSHTDTAKGGKGNDYLAGGHGRNILKGDGWEDILVGNQDDAFYDQMHGGSGFDRLYAGRVKDSSRTTDDRGLKVGPAMVEDEHYNITAGNVMWGGDGEDTFVLHPESYVHIMDFLPGEDFIVIEGLGNRSLEESIEVVYHPTGVFGQKTFRIVLDGEKVLAEIDLYRSMGPDFDPGDSTDVAAAIARITAELHGVNGRTFFGSHNGEHINGTAWNDTVYGWGGDDVINGGDGADIVYGGGGNDTIRGGAGRDALYGDHGNDTLWGGDGNDVIEGA